MNAESFVQYVKQLSMLYQLPYEELKSLSMEYPYFQNLHLLLALKSKLEDHYDYKKNLARAATYSIDRAQLYRTLTQLESLVKKENFLMHEEFLELQDISQVEQKLKDLELVPKEEAPSIDLSDFEPAMPAAIPQNDPVVENLTSAPAAAKNRNKQPVTPSTQQLSGLDTIIQDCAAVAQYVHKYVRHQQRGPVQIPGPTLDIERKKKEFKNYLRKVKSKKPKPMPKQSFSTWVEQFQPAHVKPHLSDLMEAKKREKKKRKGQPQATEPTQVASDNLTFFAQKSVKENPTMASETLAELLVAQMQYRKAIKVYERLSLIFPEKSAFFAEKIENLKKLIS